ncbi:MAG: hypothetical protein NTW95_03320 [Candidatus Aminicenantes bacterium]|nr:hypothetical protein [Candidatus Aminicenantes bacterium]
MNEFLVVIVIKHLLKECYHLNNSFQMGLRFVEGKTHPNFGIIDASGITDELLQFIPGG